MGCVTAYLQHVNTQTFNEIYRRLDNIDLKFDNIDKKFDTLRLDIAQQFRKYSEDVDRKHDLAIRYMHEDNQLTMRMMDKHFVTQYEFRAFSEGNKGKERDN